MSFFELSFGIQAIVILLLIVMLFVLTAWAVFLTKFFKSKFRPEVHVFWPLMTSLFVSIAIIGVGKSDPWEELALVLIAHVLAPKFIRDLPEESHTTQ